jgi:hypothetical protein
LLVSVRSGELEGTAELEPAVEGVPLPGAVEERAANRLAGLELDRDVPGRLCVHIRMVAEMARVRIGSGP